MKPKDFLKFTLFALYLLSCNSEKEKEQNKDSDNFTPAQKTMNSYIKDIKSGVEYEKILEKYYYKPDDILNGKILLFYEGFHKNLANAINNSRDSIKFYWNDEITEVKTLDWIYDKENCEENLLIIFSGYPEKTNYNCYCFTEEGKIYSNLLITDPTDRSNIWVRDDRYTSVEPKDSTKNYMHIRYSQDKNK